MRDDLINGLFISPEERNPLTLARKDARPAFPKRFYKDVAITAEANRFAIALDGRRLKTPAQADMVLVPVTAAEAVAEEWRAQGEDIRPRTVPLTRLGKAGLDGVVRDVTSPSDRIVRFARS